MKPKRICPVCRSKQIKYRKAKTCSRSCGQIRRFKNSPGLGKQYASRAGKQSTKIQHERRKQDALKLFSTLEPIQLYDLIYNRGYKSGWKRARDYYKENIRISGRILNSPSGP